VREISGPNTAVGSCVFIAKTSAIWSLVHWPHAVAAHFRKFWNLCRLSYIHCVVIVLFSCNRWHFAI